jgi:hypothetical protein
MRNLKTEVEFWTLFNETALCFRMPGYHQRSAKKKAQVDLLKNTTFGEAI